MILTDRNRCRWWQNQKRHMGNNHRKKPYSAIFERFYPKMCYTVWGGVIDDGLGKESETLEFKKTASELKEATISISSILNKHGVRTLYFGVKPNGKCLV